MKIVFVSNYYNHHQSKLAETLNILSDENFQFVETQSMREERKKLGYGIRKPQYVIEIDSNNAGEILKKIDDADVVVCGSAPEKLFQERQLKGKLTIRYNERIYKNKYQWYKWPFRLVTFYRRYGKYKNTYLLCSSAYTAVDYTRHLVFLNKTYKWGYFPETKRYENINAIIEKKQKNHMLWCGRFLDWKHPDDALKVALHLKQDGIQFTLNFIGTGNMEQQLKQMISEYQLDDCVHILGAMSPEKVRAYMEQAEIYLFTSDRQEGWGAVLNESMNSGCAVVASHAIGAVPFLIKNNENGLVYKSGDIDMLYHKVKYLLEHPEEQKKLGTAAYSTIVEEWNAEVAADRLINLSKHILAGEKYPDLYETGPCSKAKIMKDNWLE